MNRATWERIGAAGGILGGLAWAGFPLSWLAVAPGRSGTFLAPYEAAGPALFAVPLALSLGAVGLRQSRRRAETATGRWGFRLLFVGLLAVSLGTLAEFWVLALLDTLTPLVDASDRETVRTAVGAGLAAVGLGTVLVGRAVERRPTTAGEGVALLLSWPLSGVLLAVTTLAAVDPWMRLLAVTAPVGLAWALVGARLWPHHR